MNAIERLLPCPFCGGKAEMSNLLDCHGEQVFYVRCHICHAKRESLMYFKEEAIEYWNERSGD